MDGSEQYKKFRQGVLLVFFGMIVFLLGGCHGFRTTTDETDGIYSPKPAYKTEDKSKKKSTSPKPQRLQDFVAAPRLN